MAVSPSLCIYVRLCVSMYVYMYIQSILAVMYDYYYSLCKSCGKFEVFILHLFYICICYIVHVHTFTFISFIT